MNKMLGYLKDYKRESVLAPLFKMLEATFDLFVPLVMADIVNIGIAEFIKISSIGRLKTDKIRVLDQAPLTFFDISDRNRGFKASLKQYVGI